MLSLNLQYHPSISSFVPTAAFYTESISWVTSCIIWSRNYLIINMEASSRWLWMIPQDRDSTFLVRQIHERGSWAEDKSLHSAPFSKDVSRPFGGTMTANDNSAFYFGAYQIQVRDYYCETESLADFVPCLGHAFDFVSDVGQVTQTHGKPHHQAPLRGAPPKVFRSVQLGCLSSPTIRTRIRRCDNFSYLGQVDDGIYYPRSGDRIG